MRQLFTSPFHYFLVNIYSLISESVSDIPRSLPTTATPSTLPELNPRHLSSSRSQQGSQGSQGILTPPRTEKRTAPDALGPSPARRAPAA